MSPKRPFLWRSEETNLAASISCKDHLDRRHILEHLISVIFITLVISKSSNIEIIYEIKEFDNIILLVSIPSLSFKLSSSLTSLSCIERLWLSIHHPNNNFFNFRFIIIVVNIVLHCLD